MIALVNVALWFRRRYFAGMPAIGAAGSGDGRGSCAACELPPAAPDVATLPAGRGWACLVVRWVALYGVLQPVSATYFSARPLRLDLAEDAPGSAVEFFVYEAPKVLHAADAGGVRGRRRALVLHPGAHAGDPRRAEGESVGNVLAAVLGS